MLADKRHSKILGIVNDEGSATVGDLAERIGISESTIRRDLAQLADAGKLNKVHGGAVALDAEDVQRDVPVAERSAKNVAQKRAIAQAAARLVGPQDFVYLDAGSSVDLLVDCLAETGATYATDSVSHALKLASRGYVLEVGNVAMEDTAANLLADASVREAYLGG